MYPFFESIRCLNGRIYNIAYHNRRVEKTLLHHYGYYGKVDLRKIISIPTDQMTGLYKVRVRYGKEFDKPVISRYQSRPIKSIKLVVMDEMDYAFKYEDRTLLQKAWKQRATADDILIIRNGLLTDTSYANVALWNGTVWHTPKRPLLPGTMRQRYLDMGKISAVDISVNDIKKYQKICLINALNYLNQIVIPIKDLME